MTLPHSALDDEQVPQSLTMHSQIKTEPSGETTAFTANGELVMNYGRPSVSWTLCIKDLEEWTTTLEEVIPETHFAHQHSLRMLKTALTAAHNWHKREHEAVVTDAPSEEDLMTYLTSYAAAMAWEAMEGRK